MPAVSLQVPVNSIKPSGVSSDSLATTASTATSTDPSLSSARRGEQWEDGARTRVEGGPLASLEVERAALEDQCNDVADALVESLGSKAYDDLIDSSKLLKFLKDELSEPTALRTFQDTRSPDLELQALSDILSEAYQVIHDSNYNPDDRSEKGEIEQIKKDLKPFLESEPSLNIEERRKQALELKKAFKVSLKAVIVELLKDSTLPKLEARVRKAEARPRFDTASDISNFDDSSVSLDYSSRYGDEEKEDPISNQCYDVADALFQSLASKDYDDLIDGSKLLKFLNDELSEPTVLRTFQETRSPDLDLEGLRDILLEAYQFIYDFEYDPANGSEKNDLDQLKEGLKTCQDKPKEEFKEAFDNVLREAVYNFLHGPFKVKN